LGALQHDPQIPFRVRHQSLNRTNGEGTRDRKLEKLEVQAIEANQTLLGTDPQVPVGGLCDRRNRSPGKSFVAPPPVSNVLGDRAVRINGKRWES
jgi:hypothetical protein